MQGLHNGGYLWEVDITIQHASNIQAIFLAFQLELTGRKGSIFWGVVIILPAGKNKRDQ